VLIQCCDARGASKSGYKRRKPLRLPADKVPMSQWATSFQNQSLAKPYSITWSVGATSFAGESLSGITRAQEPRRVIDLLEEAF
jgi:hypothetical protein